LIAKARGGGGGDAGGASDHATAMNSKNIIIVRETNRPDQIESALLCPGRLNQLIYIPLPDGAPRLSIFKIALDKSLVAPDVNLTFLVKCMHGYSHAFGHPPLGFST
jgi:transitional endoplasmic reticulum ATPase